MDPKLLNPQINVVKNAQDKQKQKGTGFSNINRIIGANVGAGGQMGSRIASNLEEMGKSAQEKIGGAQQQFQQGFQQGLGQAQQQMQGAQNILRLPNESDADYAARVSKQQVDTSKIAEGLKGAEYKGPQGLENYQALQNRATGVSRMSDLARSNIGQGLLAKQAIAAPGRYTRGQSALDQLLIGQDAAAQKAIRDARQNISGVAQKAQEATRIAQEAGQGAAEGLQKTKDDISEKLLGEISGLKEVGTKQAQAYTQKGREIAELLQKYDPKMSNFSDEQKQTLKDFLANYERTGEDYGLGLDKFKSIQTADPTMFLRTLGSSFTGGDPNAVKFSDEQRKLAEALTGVSQSDDATKELFRQNFEKNLFGADEAAGDLIKTTNEKYLEQKAAYDAQQKAYKNFDMKQFIGNLWAGKQFSDPMQQQIANRLVNEYHDRYGTIRLNNPETMTRLLDDVKRFKDEHQKTFSPIKAQSAENILREMAGFSQRIPETTKSPTFTFNPFRGLTQTSMETGVPKKIITQVGPTQAETDKAKKQAQEAINQGLQQAFQQAGKKKR